MSPPVEQDYIGLSETSLVERSSDKISSSSTSSNSLCSEEEKGNVLNLKETELRLGLPGSQTPERKTVGSGLSLFGKDLEDKTNGFSLGPVKSSVSGAKRGFSDAINGCRKWGSSMTGGSDVDFGKVDAVFTPNGGGGGSKNINTLKSCLPGPTAKEVGAPPTVMPVQKETASAEKEPGTAPASKAQVVGWPPIRSFRKNTLATNLSKNNDVEGKSEPSCLYVKVSMDGAPYLRKVDLKTYLNYAELSAALQKMFSGFTSGCASDGHPEQEMHNEKGLKDILQCSEYVLTYEDKDGDWMLVGDVPWEMFINSCKRLRIMKGSEATGLGRSKQGKTVEWTSKDLLQGLEEFVPIYETRPIKNNMYGMGFDHSFGLWFITRWLKPELMIESGAFKGHSTWVLRKAMPDTPILSITPRHPEKYLKKGPAYVDGNCTYFAGKDFVDFGSVEWGKVMKKHGIKDLSRVLVFFDDHQNELKRLKQALKAGFKHLVFEDNYDTGTGDHYSFRQICDQFYIRGGGHSCFKDSDEARVRFRRKKFWEKAVDIDELCGPSEAWWGVRGQMRDDFNHSNKAITYEEHFQNSRFVESVLDVYWELPPVAGPSLTHQTRYDPARAPNPIVEDGRYRLFQRLGLSRLETSVFNGYTQMLYLQISDPDA